MDYISVITRKNGETLDVNYLPQETSVEISGLSITYRGNEIILKGLDYRRIFSVDANGVCRVELEGVPCRINGEEKMLKEQHIRKLGRLYIIEIYDREIWIF